MPGSSWSVEIPISIKDNTGAGAKSAQANLTNLDRMAQKTGATKIGLMAKVNDEASSVLRSLETLAGKLARTTISIGVKVLDYATAPLRSIASLATSTIGMLGIGAGGYGLFQGLVNAPLQMADNFRATTLAFQRLMGAAQGSAYVKSLQNWAISTPFPQSQVLGFGRQLLGAGFSQDQSLKWLQTIGDAASVFNLGTQGFSTINTAVARMRSTKMLDAGAIEMMNDTGVPVWDILGQITHMSPVALRARVGSGTMSSDQYLPMIEQSLDARYGGSMGALMNTSLGGLGSQLKDLFDVNVLQRWGKGLSDVIIPQMQTLNDWFGKNGDTVAKWGKALEDAGHTVATTVFSSVDGLMGKLTALVNSKEWGDATTLGQKLRLAWDTVIAQPFSEWWSKNGASWAGSAGTLIGSTLGTAIGAGVGALLGIHPDPKAVQDAGYSFGVSFVDGFKKGFAEMFDVGAWIRESLTRRNNPPALEMGSGFARWLNGVGNDIASQVATVSPWLASPVFGSDPSSGSGIPEGSNRRRGGGGGGLGGGGQMGPGSGASPVPGDIAAWRSVIQSQSGALGSDPNFVNTVLAGAYAESGLDPNRVQAGGGGRGFFQFDVNGMGAGLSKDQLFSEQYQASQIIPLYAKYWAQAPAGLSPAQKASWVAAMAERPAGYTDPASTARQNYASAYGVVSSGSTMGALSGGAWTGGSLISNQFDFGPSGTGELSAADAAAACGPTAALAFARKMGRNPTIGEAIALARSVGWNNQTGMAGPASEVALLSKMGVGSSYHQGAGAADVISALGSGNPVILSTPNHYFVADQYDPNRGLFHVGGSGQAMRGGSAWETWGQIATQGGGVNGDITLDPEQQRGGPPPAGGASMGGGAGSLIGSIAIYVTSTATNIAQLAEEIADPVAAVIARKLEAKNANTPTRTS